MGQKMGMQGNAEVVDWDLETRKKLGIFSRELGCWVALHREKVNPKLVLECERLLRLALKLKGKDIDISPTVEAEGGV
jgi:hypothetical protein